MSGKLREFQGRKEILVTEIGLKVSTVFVIVWPLSQQLKWLQKWHYTKLKKKKIKRDESWLEEEGTINK